MLSIVHRKKTPVRGELCPVPLKLRPFILSERRTRVGKVRYRNLGAALPNARLNATLSFHCIIRGVVWKAR
jgi:hypothetical protein